MSKDLLKRTISFSDIAAYGRPALGLKDPDFDPATSRDGLDVEKRIKLDLALGRGPKFMQSLASFSTVIDERKFELEVDNNLYLTTTPDQVYVTNGGMDIVEIKRRQDPVILDYFQAIIAIRVIGVVKGTHVRARTYYHGSGRILTMEEDRLDADQLQDLNTIVMAADLIKVAKVVHDDREWQEKPIKGGVEAQSTHAYLDEFKGAMRRTGNRAGLLISYQFPEWETEAD